MSARVVTALYLIAVCVSAVSAQRVCPIGCTCFSKSVLCKSNTLERIPDNLAEDVTKLGLKGNHFVTATLQKKNFSAIPNIVEIDLADCGIESIETGAFEDLSKLTVLTLNENRLKYLTADVFRGLNLDNLMINGNPHVRLDPHVFRGMTTKGLFLSGCYLHRLDPQVLAPLNNHLEVLWLDRNRLKSLPVSLKPLFSRLKHLRLGENPLICDCDLIWLKQLFDDKPGVFPHEKLPLCEKPSAVRGLSFAALDVKQMSCSVPRLDDIEIQLNGQNVTISCSGSSAPAPALTWRTPDGNSHVTNAKIGAERTTAQIVVQKLDISRGIYTCLADSSGGNASLSLNLNWLSAVTTTTSTTTSTSQTTRLPPATCPPVQSSPSPTQACPALDSRRQFTLLELLGAAAGAFCLAIVFSIFCLICAYKKLTRRHTEKPERYAPSTSSAGKENLYSMVSAEERERFSLEEKERLYAAGHLREFGAPPPPPTSSFQTNYDPDTSRPLIHAGQYTDMPHTLTHNGYPSDTSHAPLNGYPTDTPHAPLNGFPTNTHVPNGQFPIYGHSHLVNPPQVPVSFN